MLRRFHLHNYFENVVLDKTFLNEFDGLSGDQLKTAPRGFPKDHPQIQWLRHKDHIVSVQIDPDEILSENFINSIQGKKSMGKFKIVSGGIIGKIGDIVVDNILNPNEIIGIADGKGGFYKKMKRLVDAKNSHPIMKEWDNRYFREFVTEMHEAGSTQPTLGVSPLLIFLREGRQ